MWFKHGFLFKRTNYRFKHFCLNSQWYCSLNVLVQQRLGSLSIWTWNACFRINSLIWRPVSTQFVFDPTQTQGKSPTFATKPDRLLTKAIGIVVLVRSFTKNGSYQASGGFRWFRSAWFLELSKKLSCSPRSWKMSGINTSVCEPKNDGGQGQGVLPMYHKAQFEGSPH